MNQFTINARSFKTLVNVVSASASTDSLMAPDLNAICFHADGGHITAWATDRYHIAGCRIAAESIATEPATVAIPLKAVRHIASLWRPTRSLNPSITFAAADDHVTVTADGSGWVVTEASFPTVDWTGGNKPIIESVKGITRDAQRGGGEVGVFSVNPELVAHFTNAHKHFGPLQWSLTARNAPVGIRSKGGEFVGVVMPIRHEGEHPLPGWLE